jgi:hypothetical protein
MKLLTVGLGVSGMMTCALFGCGTYEGLRPEAASVTATTTRPEGNCKTLGSLTGKGGGASGGYVSNESLIEYAVNDLRNQAVVLGATHVVYSTPSMGGNQGTTTSAMVMGEALRCDAGEEPSSPAGPVASTKSGGCDFDTQCKGERVCVNRKCVEPGSASASESAGASDAAAAKPESAASEH